MVNTIASLLKVFVGLILVLVSIWGTVTFKGWGQATIDLIQGGIVLGVIGIGLVFILLGFIDFKG